MHIRLCELQLTKQPREKAFIAIILKKSRGKKNEF